jgi:hypothetical protein
LTTTKEGDTVTVVTPGQRRIVRQGRVVQEVLTQPLPPKPDVKGAQRRTARRFFVVGASGGHFLGFRRGPAGFAGNPERWKHSKSWERRRHVW